jgi:hypothetical protein
MASGVQSTYDLRFQHPATHILAGPSGSGKTERVGSILKHKNALLRDGSNIRCVIFCYVEWQPVYDRLSRDGVVTQWVKSIPTLAEFKQLVQPHKKSGGCIVVMDDSMNQVGPDMDQICRVTARHNNASVFLLFQNLFPPAKESRNISLNVKYAHIHKNPRDNAQIGHFARQFSPSGSKWLVDAFFAATRQRYSCLLIDSTQECPDHLRVRSNYLPEERPMRAWGPRGSFPLHVYRVTVLPTPPAVLRPWPADPGGAGEPRGARAAVGRGREARELREASDHLSGARSPPRVRGEPPPSSWQAGKRPASQD